jgi:hypothetical protein
MQKVTVEILNTNVLKLLQDLEQLQLIRLQNPIENAIGSNFWASNLKGAMTKQAKTEIDNQLLELR